MIGASYIMVSDNIGLKSSVMDAGNLVISGIKAQNNRQIDSLLVVSLVYSRVLFFLPKMQPHAAYLVPKN